MAIALKRGLGRPRDLSAVGGLQTAALLLAWRCGEVSRAQGRFDRLPREDLEDIYDETSDEMRRRHHNSEDHLRRALRRGIRMRALNRIRDRKTHERIVDEAAGKFYSQAQRRVFSSQPEQALLAQEDEFVITEFISELTAQELPVFTLIAEGLSWRAIASRLGIPETESRKLARSCESKRERFSTLYETGRLCGYRSHVIGGLLCGEPSGEMALEQAAAHLSHCRSCQREHQLTTSELRARFDRGALALLQPMFTGKHLGFLDRLQAVLGRGLRLVDRLPAANTALRERAVESVAGSALTVKAATVVAGVIALSGAGIEAHRVVDPERRSHHTPRTSQTRITNATQALSTPARESSRPFGWPRPTSAISAEPGPGHLLSPNGSPGHLLPAETTGPGRLIEQTRGPGHLLASASPRSPSHTSATGRASSAAEVPIKLLDSKTASTASVAPSPSPPLKAANTQRGPGRLLGQ